MAIAQNRVLTTIRMNGQEVDVALKLESGDTVWSQAIDVPEQDLAYGMGPFATPLVDRDRVIFLGGTGIVRSRQFENGNLQWQRELEKEYQSASQKTVTPRVPS